MQTTYTEKPNFGEAGMLADASNFEAFSRAFETDADYEFGRVAIAGASDNTFKAPAGASGIVLGVTLYNPTFAGGEEKPADGINLDKVVALCRKGVVWVTVSEDVDYGDPVYFQHTAGGGAAVGDWYKTADANRDQIAAAQFVSTATSGNLAKLQLNLP